MIVVRSYLTAVALALAACTAPRGPGSPATGPVEVQVQAVAPGQGTTPSSEPAASDERRGGCPPSMARVGGFCLDRTEVTVAEYGACVGRGPCTAPSATANNSDDGAPETARWSALCNRLRSDRARHPVNCVTRVQATEYCASRGARLPSLGEWSSAWGGKYPWGDEPPSAKRLNACDRDCVALLKTIGPRWVGSYRETESWRDGYGATAPVGSFPEGASREGVLDLSGNVSEWLAPPPERRGTTTAGASFMDAGERIAGATSLAAPTMTSPSIGFRCAADLGGGEDRGR